jgi:hypothetical protein
MMKGHPMSRYECKFVRIGENSGSKLFGVRDQDHRDYEHVVHEHAKDGWRLAQVFAPGAAALGTTRYYEFIFKREVAEEASTHAQRGRAVA